MNKEPVLTAGVIVGILNAFLVMAISMHWFDLNDVQLGNITTFAGMFLAAVIPIAVAFWPRSQVTPTSTPRIETADGQLVRLVREDTKMPVAGDTGPVNK